MNFLVWLLVAVGAFLIFAGIKNKSPLQLLTASLRGK